MAAIQADGLVKDYPGVRAVDGASFTVEEGEIFGFFGPNGAGKSTTMRLLTGLSRLDGGSATVAGIDVRRRPVEVREEVAILPEVPKPYGRMSGRAYIEWHAGMVGVEGSSLEERLAEIEDVVQVEGFVDKQIKSMSMGQRQRTELTRLLLSDAQVLFLDEPFNSVDTQTRRRLRERFREMVDAGRTLFYTSHDLLESEHFVDRYAFIVEGSIVATGSARDLREQHLVRRIRMEVSDNDRAVEVAGGLGFVEEARTVDGSIEVTLTEDHDEGDVVEALVDAGVKVRGVEQVGTIEDVFEVLAEKGRRGDPDREEST